LRELLFAYAKYPFTSVVAPLPQKSTDFRGPIKNGKGQNTPCNLSTLEQIIVCFFRLG
jgi:hypothetical protein